MKSSFVLKSIFATPRFYNFYRNLLKSTSINLQESRHYRVTHKQSSPAKIRLKKMETFSLDSYDCLGFDLDNTLVKYRVKNMIYHEYDVLAEFLVEKGYSQEYLLKPIDEDIDFLQKGLILDFKRGNLLRICPDGSIQIATHGTKFLTKEEIACIYGVDKKWEVTDKYCQDMLVAWNGTLAEYIRTCLDYFDMPAALAFARIVDSIDFKAEGKQETYDIWPDILEGLMKMYTRDLFATGESKYFEALKNNPSHFIYKCDQKVLDWLKEIKKKKISFLVTGSYIDFASLTAGYALGKDWREYFDVIICFSKKPGFFTMERDFLQLEGLKETTPIKAEDMQRGEIYTQGNFKELKKFIAKLAQKADPQILYIGDNLIQDIFTPNKHMNVDTVAIVEEMMAEGVDANAEYEVLSSNAWGSYFHTKGEDTLWERIIRKHAKLCVPSVDELAKNPLDFKYNLDYKYYPHDPFDPYTK